MSSLIYRDIQLARQRSARQFEARRERWLAKLVRFEGNLQVPARPGYVYAQQLPEDDAPPPVPVLCVGVQARENLRVWIERNHEGDWEVTGFWRGITQQTDYDQQAYLALHARDHEWPDRVPHADAVSVYQRALVPLRSSPGAAGLTVRVEPYRYLKDGDLVLFAGDASVDLSGSQPAVGLARYVGVYLDTDTNTIGTVDGDTTIDADPVEPDSPTFPARAITSAMVRLDGSQTTFSERDFVDLRIFLGLAEVGAVADYPFDIITVDQAEASADYSNLDTAFATEAAGTAFAIGPGTWTLTANGLPDGGYLFSFGRDANYQISSTYTVGGQEVGLPLDGDGYAVLAQVWAADATANDVVGIRVETGATVRLDSVYSRASNTGAGDAYALYIDTFCGVHIEAGLYQAVVSAGSAYGISAGAATTVYLEGCPTIDAPDGFFTGAGSFQGAFQDADGNLYEVNGVAGTEKLVGSYLKASDGAPDPAWSVDATGNLVTDGGVLDLNGVADALVLDTDGDTSISAPTDDQIDFEAANADQIHVSDGMVWPDADDDIDLGDGTHEFKDAYFDGVIYADVVDLEGNADALVLDADGDTTISAPTDDQVDFEVASADEAHLTAYGLSAQNHAFRVKNSSGGAVTAGDVGYIDDSGEYVETTTEHDDVPWCVVVMGAADGSDIYVARRGRVTVTLDQNCSAGDYLYTSTTAGQATSETYVQPEVFAVALTANASGAGGTCSALLLTERKTYPLTSADVILWIDAMADSDWRSTCNGAPVGAVVTYNAPLVSGAENAIVPQSATAHGKLLLHNTTAGELARIDSVNTAANTITVTVAADVAAWNNGDTIVVRSQTNAFNDGGGSYVFDAEIPATTTIPALTTQMHLYWDIRDSGAASQNYLLHPFEADDSAKRYILITQVANVSYRGYALVSLINRRFCTFWQASGAATGHQVLKIIEVIVAAP